MTPTKNTTYDKEFYVVILALRYWRHYLLPQEFFFPYHEALKYINSQKKLNAKHGYKTTLSPYDTNRELKQSRRRF